MMRSAMAGVMNYVDDAATDVDKTCMPAGQGIGGIADIIPAGEVVRRVLREAAEVVGGLGRLT
jgi:enoyl-[acyl-carrier protein] reductase II